MRKEGGKELLGMREGGGPRGTMKGVVMCEIETGGQLRGIHYTGREARREGGEVDDGAPWRRNSSHGERGGMEDELMDQVGGKRNHMRKEGEGGRWRMNSRSR